IKLFSTNRRYSTTMKQIFKQTVHLVSRTLLKRPPPVFLLHRQFSTETQESLSQVVHRVMNKMLNQGNYQHVRNLFDKLVAEKQEVHIPHYNAVLQSYAMEGDFQKVDEFFKSMESKNVTPNYVTLSIFLNTYLMQNKWEDAKKMIIYMKEKYDIQ